jgi:hypothetical protein
MSSIRAYRLPPIPLVLVAVIGVVAVCGPTASAQLLTFNTAGNLGTETSEPSVSNAAGLAPSSLTLGVGITPAANGNRFGGSAFFDTGDPGRFEVALIDGSLTKLARVSGTGFSFSPDKTQMAFFDEQRVYVSSPSGADKKLVVEIPENLGNTGVIDKSTTWINWTPDGRRVLVFDQNRLLIVRLLRRTRKTARAGIKTKGRINAKNV